MAPKAGCAHKCKDKSSCAHACCKRGLTGAAAAPATPVSAALVDAPSKLDEIDDLPPPPPPPPKRTNSPLRPSPAAAAARSSTPPRLVTPSKSMPIALPSRVAQLLMGGGGGGGSAAGGSGGSNTPSRDASPLVAPSPTPSTPRSSFDLSRDNSGQSSGGSQSSQSSQELEFAPPAPRLATPDRERRRKEEVRTQSIGWFVFCSF